MTSQRQARISAKISGKISCYHHRWMVKRKSPVFPKLNQPQMAAFLGIKRVRLSWATAEGIVERDAQGLYHPAVVTAQWLAYERSSRARGGKRGSEFELARARLTRAKAAAAERKLAVLDGQLVSTGDIVELVKTVSLRIRNKLQTSLPRLARACYSAPSIPEAIKAARAEFDVLLGELSALRGERLRGNFEVVNDDENVERPATG